MILDIPSIQAPTDGQSESTIQVLEDMLRACVMDCRVGEVAYELALPPAFLAIHKIFHVSMLCRYVHDESHVLQYDAVGLNDRLTYIEEPVASLDRVVRPLRSRAIPMVKVCWWYCPVDEATWETEREVQEQFPD
ncbi:hypothetical protein MTR67_039207 [Solanum verrucosum]|uniref:Tf2-1-like SH3-like domain-containing protein n=1 Tax=Solanum verrucosum TaxID=315347 RepID=A0AAF0UH00_SOLVR|nr:hypothetical protein MTR67_039207 [Solanum verrucosum]